MSRRIPRLVAPALALTLLSSALSACSSGDDSGYMIEARFSRTVALYEGADVLVMGIPVGSVDHIDTDAEGVLVSISMRGDVPLPADATAAIVPASLIGERNVVLGPAWVKGSPKLGDGDLIPVERTIIPVEPDEALESITNLLESLDPESVASLLKEGSNALDGNGDTINEALLQLSTLIPYLSEQDDELLSIAADINVLANVVRGRDAQIAELLKNFSTVADVLADERDSLVTFLDSLSSLTAEGKALLTAYEVTLPENLETVASVALTIKVNGDSVGQALLALRQFQDGVLTAYNPETETIRARIYTSQSGLDPLVAALKLLGLPGLLGCDVLALIDPTCAP